MRQTVSTGGGNDRGESQLYLPFYLQTLAKPTNLHSKSQNSALRSQMPAIDQLPKKKPVPLKSAGRQERKGILLFHVESLIRGYAERLESEILGALGEKKRKEFGERTRHYRPDKPSGKMAYELDAETIVKNARWLQKLAGGEVGSTKNSAPPIPYKDPDGKYTNFEFESVDHNASKAHAKNAIKAATKIVYLSELREFVLESDFHGFLEYCRWLRWQAREAGSGGKHHVQAAYELIDFGKANPEKGRKYEITAEDRQFKEALRLVNEYASATGQTPSGKS